MAAELEGNMPGVLMFLMSALNLVDETLSSTKQNTKVIPHIQHAVLPPLPLCSKHTGLQPAWHAGSLPLHLEFKLKKKEEKNTRKHVLLVAQVLVANILCHLLGDLVEGESWRSSEWGPGSSLVKCVCHDAS